MQYWDYDIFDVDPYSSPYEALALIAKSATKPTLGLYVTDGCLRQQAKVRGYFPKILLDPMGWQNKIPHTKESRRQRAWVYWHYPEVFYKIMGKLFAPRYVISDVRVVLARHPAIANYAAVRCEGTA